MEIINKKSLLKVPTASADRRLPGADLREPAAQNDLSHPTADRRPPTADSRPLVF
jgi:hypothetical protein